MRRGLLVRMRLRVKPLCAGDSAMAASCTFSLCTSPLLLQIQLVAIH